MTAPVINRKLNFSALCLAAVAQLYSLKFKHTIVDSSNPSWVIATLCSLASSGVNFSVFKKPSYAWTHLLPPQWCTNRGRKLVYVVQIRIRILTRHEYGYGYCHLILLVFILFSTCLNSNFPCCSYCLTLRNGGGWFWPSTPKAILSNLEKIDAMEPHLSNVLFCGKPNHMRRKLGISSLH